MVEHDHDRDGGERSGLEGNEDLGMLLRRLWGELSLGDVNRLSGVSSYYRQNLSDGAKEHRVLHETYQIICETLSEQTTGSSLKWRVCRQADRFAAAALMQPEGASLVAQTSGLDPLALQRVYRWSYASATLCLAEVVSEFPLMAVLYGRDRDDISSLEAGTEPSELRATILRRSRGVGTLHSELH